MMTKLTIPKWIKDTLLTILFCASGFLAIWVAKKHVGMQQEAVFVAFLVLPILIYVIVAGRLLEVKAFGTEAKFADIAKQTVEPSLGTIKASVEDMEIVQKQGLAELQKRKNFLDETKPIILTLVIGNQEYNLNAVEAYVEALSHCPTFKGAVLLQADGRFAVYFPPRSISAILRSHDANGFIQEIKSSLVDKLRDYPGAIKRTLTKHSSNLDALNEMTLQNAEALVVLNDDGKLSGVLERPQLKSKLLLALAR